MNFVQKIIQSLKAIPSLVMGVPNYFKSLGKTRQLITVATIIFLAGGGYLVIKNFSGSPSLDTGRPLREVQVASVADLSSKRTPLPVIGSVTSVSEATIRAEISGQITHVYRKLGDYVGAGAIIAEVENSRERAALASAEAGVSSAKANAGISEISSSNQSQLLEQAKVNTINTITSAYDTIDDSIRTKIDPMFNDPTSSNPKFAVLIANFQLYTDINAQRLKSSEIIVTESTRRNSLITAPDLNKEIDVVTADVWYIKDLVEDIIAGLNQSSPNQSISQSTVDGYKATAGLVRTSLNSTLSTLSAAKDNLSARQAQFDIAQKQSGGGTQTTSDALLRQAEANLRLAQIALQKTIIRSPISGSVNSFALERGDYVSATERIAVVSNNAALEVRAYITESDAAEIAAGASALINGKINGAVTRVAPALDPLTKKIEVRVGITEDTERSLINGESVQVTIARTAATGDQNSFTIPISAIKITADGPVVFTVESGTLISHPIVEGALLGDTIEIQDGLTPFMEIVTDARGLKNGATVLIKNDR